MKLRVVSDGSPRGTFVVDENNEKIDGIVEIKWEVRVNESSLTTLVMRRLPMEVVTQEVLMSLDVSDEDVQAAIESTAAWLDAPPIKPK